MENKTQEQSRFLIQAAYIAVIAGMICLGVKYLLAWFFPFVAGYLIALAVRPVSVFAAKRCSISQRTAGRVVLCGVYLLLAALLVLFGTILTGYLRQAAAALPGWYSQVLRPAVETLEEFLKKWGSHVLPGIASQLSLEASLGDIQKWLVVTSSNALSKLGSLTAMLPGFLMTFLFTIACSLLISGNYQETASFIARQAPPPMQKILFSAKKGTGAAVLGYCKAYLLLMTVTFAELLAGLWLLGIKDALLIAAFAAVLDFLPVLGVGTLLLPWALLLLLQGNHAMAAGLALLYAIIMVVHNILEPRLIGKQLGLHPLVSICAVYLGFRVYGITGMILAPIAAQMVIGLHHAGVVRLWK